MKRSDCSFSQHGHGPFAQLQGKSPGIVQSNQVRAVVQVQVLHQAGAGCHQGPCVSVGIRVQVMDSLR